MLNTRRDRACRKAARLISESQDHRLGWRDRVSLRVHLAICEPCTRYQGQIRLLRGAMGRWQSYSDEP